MVSPSMTFSSVVPSKRTQDDLSGNDVLCPVWWEQFVLEVVVDGVDPALTGSALTLAEGILKAWLLGVNLI